MKTWDAAIIGGGVIGLSIALELRRDGASVLVLDRHQPGREASWAAGGMLAATDPENDARLRTLSLASAKLYPEFVLELEKESGVRVQLQREGTIRFLVDDCCDDNSEGLLSEEELRKLEPHLDYVGPAVFLQEDSVDPRQLVEALVTTARNLDVDIVSGAEVYEVPVSRGAVTGVKTVKTEYGAKTVINCAGAWAGNIGPVRFPTKPMKGQMLAVAAAHHHGEPLVRRVLRHPKAYVIPRADGRIVIGATVEDVGFDKSVDAGVIQKLHQNAAELVPLLGEARMLESWAGLRPGTLDDLPVMSPSEVQGYFIATGHYRDGILLAPITARVMSRLVRGLSPEFNLAPFAVSRFVL